MKLVLHVATREGALQLCSRLFFIIDRASGTPPKGHGFFFILRVDGGFHFEIPGVSLSILQDLGVLAGVEYALECPAPFH